MVNGDGGHAEAPHQHLQPARAQLGRDGFEQRTGPVQTRRQRHGDEHVEPVEKLELRVTRQVAHQLAARAKSALRHEPAQMTPQKAVLPRRVGIRRGVRVAVMMAVVRCPPQRAALRRSRPQQREQELHQPGGAKRAMGEVAVIEASDGEHAQRIEHERRCHRRAAPAHPEDTRAARVQGNEGRHAKPLDALARRRCVSRAGRHVGGNGRGVEPGAQHGAAARPGGGSRLTSGRSGRHRSGHVTAPAGSAAAGPTRWWSRAPATRGRANTIDPARIYSSSTCSGVPAARGRPP